MSGRVVAILLLFASVAVAQDRFALVIGNGKYTGAAELRNPPNDAAAIATALEKLDFKVSRAIDSDLSATEKAVVAFRKSLTKKSVAVFFYAGHGLQVKGENFLVPVDAQIDEESQVKRKCYPVEELLTELDGSPAALKIVILDSCRDNPLTRSWSRSAGSGLASITQVPDGTVIAFSTAPGKTALDGRGANSPFTKHLVASLERRPAEGLELIGVLRATGQAVSKEIGQRPWLNFDTSLDDYFLWRATNSASITPKSIADLPTESSTPTLPAGPSAPLPRSLKRVDHPKFSAIECVENSLGMKFALIPKGKYVRGAGGDDRDAAKNERPPREETIYDAFYACIHEVTLGQFLTFYHAAKYKTVAEENGHAKGIDSKTGELREGREFVPWTTGFPQTREHPVVNVCLEDARAFCAWLSEKEGLKYRLPSEKEWEYICRGMKQTRYWNGDDAEQVTRIDNIADGTLRETKGDWKNTVASQDGFAFTAPVGSFAPNPFGLYDLHGNVEEWCEDRYFPSDYEVVELDDEWMVRGGSWLLGPAAARASRRGRGGHLSEMSCARGFRVILEK